MFDKILLPLDGSELAEMVLPYGEELASRLGAELTLFHVCGVDHKDYQHMHQMYLSGIAELMRQRIKKSRPKGEVTINVETLVGEPVETIANYIEKKGFGLMIMASSGASGLKLWVLGSIADKVFRTVNIPTMLVRDVVPEVEGHKRLINRLLVPLDGSSASELALPIAEELASRLNAKISLFQMARRTYLYAAMPIEAGTGGIDYAKLDSAEEKRAMSNLLSTEKKLRQKGFTVTHRIVLGTDPAEGIIETGKQVNADLVVMSTRGSSPVARWVMGSTAEKVLREGALPLILVRR